MVVDLHAFPETVDRPVALTVRVEDDLAPADLAPEVEGAAAQGEEGDEEAFGDEDDIAAEDESGQNGSRP